MNDDSLLAACRTYAPPADAFEGRVILVTGATGLIGREVLDALRAYTSSAAYALRLEQRVGTIEVGKDADLVALGEDITRVQPHEIHDVPVELTMMGGRVTPRSSG